jgi:hypothetical protein
MKTLIYIVAVLLLLAYQNILATTLYIQEPEDVIKKAPTIYTFLS